MRSTLIVGATAGALLAAGVAAPALAVAPGKADLSVLHGIPGLTVDVYVNGALTLDDFAPGDLAGPLSLDPGTYTVALTASDAADDSAPLIPAFDLPLAADMSYTAVAHLDAAGDPTASLFTNDISETASGEGRLTVRHVAAAPAVDILANGAAAFTNVENPDEVKADLPVGTYSAAVALAGSTTPIPGLGPVDVTLAEGKNLIVYAWGSATADPATLALAVQTVDTAMEMPAAVETGTQGLAADNGSTSSAMLIAIAGLALVAAGGGLVVARSRR